MVFLISASNFLLFFGIIKKPYEKTTLLRKNGLRQFPTILAVRSVRAEAIKVTRISVDGTAIGMLYVKHVREWDIFLKSRRRVS